MANESTPLIQTVRLAPPRTRYRHQNCRRFCTFACTCVLILGFASFLAHLVLIRPYFYHHDHHSRYASSHQSGKRLSHEQLKKILLETPTADLAREWSQYYTSGPHLAGKNFSQVTSCYLILRTSAFLFSFSFFAIWSTNTVLSFRPTGQDKSGRAGESMLVS